MKHQIFVIHDAKAQAFMQPWFLLKTGMAERAFADCVNDKDHNFGRHPEDYNLFIIGEYDDATAAITSHSPEAMGNGITFLQLEITDQMAQDGFDKYQYLTNDERDKLGIETLKGDHQ